LFQVWLFYYPVSYLKALFGIGNRKAPRGVHFLSDIGVVQAAVQVAAKFAEKYLPGGDRLAEVSRSLFSERAE